MAEDRLRRVQEEYTQRLAETNAELEMTNRELERANRLKSEFLASMSHELRTPLHTIIGFSELLAEELEGPLNEKQQRFVEHIHKDSLHLLELINDVLDISKIEAGRLELRPEAFDFTALVAESLASVRSLAEAKAHILETSLDVPTAVEADRLRIKQVLVNLLSNAIKFTPEGGRIRLEARVQESFVVVSVSRHRRRYSRGRTRVHLRQVSSGGCDHQGRPRRHRARFGDYQTSGGTARWNDSGGKPAPAREHVSFLPSPWDRPSERLKAHENGVGGGRQGNREGTGPHGSGKVRLPGLRGRRRRGGRGGGPPDSSRSDHPRHSHARLGRLRSHRKAPPRRRIRRHADHRSDRQRHDGRSRARHGGGLHRLHHQAHPSRGPASRSGASVSDKQNNDALPARAVPADYRRQSRQPGDVIQRSGATGSGNPHRLGPRRGRGSGSYAAIPRSCSPTSSCRE